MKMFEIAISVGFVIITLGIIIGILVLMLAKLSPSNICESYCNDKKGTYWMATDCDGSTLECSGFCVYDNKTEYCEDIFKNITTMQS